MDSGDGKPLPRGSHGAPSGAASGPDRDYFLSRCQAMLEQIPEVKARTRLVQWPVSVQVADKEFPETMDVVDPNFLQIIKLPLVSGAAASALAQPNSVVLSEARARKYFGDASALGKTLIMSAEYCDDESSQNCEVRPHALTVTGILRDLPHNTQLAADLMMQIPRMWLPSHPNLEPTGLDQRLGVCATDTRRGCGCGHQQDQCDLRPFD